MRFVKMTILLSSIGIVGLAVYYLLPERGPIGNETDELSSTTTHAVDAKSAR